MPEFKQGKITRFFNGRGRPRARSRKQSDGPKYLSDEKAKLRARLKLVGEETRAAYPDLERQDVRVKDAYSNTYMTSRCATIPPSSGEATRTDISVIDADTIDAAIALRISSPNANLGVMNMASERHVGGGFLTGAPAQEESLCRRTTLYPCLISVKEKCYPLPSTAVLVSLDVLIFRTGLDDDFRILPPEKCIFVTVLSVAAIRNPPVRHDNFENHSDRQLTATKIRETLRAAYHAGCRQLILGALGCGAFHNPPKAVAKVFRDVLGEAEFQAAFEKIVFAIVDSQDVTYGKTKTNNCALFREVLLGQGDSKATEYPAGTSAGG